MGFKEDFVKTWQIIYDNIKNKSLNKLHGVLITVLCFVLAIVFIHCFRVEAADCYSAPYILCAILILYATNKYAFFFKAIPLDQNDKVDLKHLKLSFLCNFLFIVARAIVYFVMFYIFIVFWVIVLKMHATIDVYSKWTWIFEKTAVTGVSLVYVKV